MTTLRSVVLVEGLSDQVALHTLAAILGRDLAAEGTEVVAMGGITNIRAFALRYGPRGRGIRLRGLYDAPEEGRLRRGLARAGIRGAETVDLPEIGFHPCSRDLEDELIRALGAESVEAVIGEAGEARALRRLRGMPAQREWPAEAVLRRFLGSKSGRKARYAALLVAAMEPAQVPAPLVAVLEKR